MAILIFEFELRRGFAYGQSGAGGIGEQFADGARIGLRALLGWG